MALLEIACFNTPSTLIASSAGADRIELCASPEIGGSTPSLSSLLSIKDCITIPIFVMIRLRGGNFVYTDIEFQEMRASVGLFKDTADGFVFGVLDSEGKVDVRRTSELVDLARPLPCTFHRAFDEVVDLYQALEDVVSSGVSCVLTSGGASSAIQGRHVLAKLVQKARGRVTVMPGGGVRSGNIEVLRAETQASFYHSSALVEDGSIASSTEIRRLKKFLQFRQQALMNTIADS